MWDGPKNVLAEAGDLVGIDVAGAVAGARESTATAGPRILRRFSGGGDGCPGPGLSPAVNGRGRRKGVR
jgi:hypothetical protein